MNAQELALPERLNMALNAFSAKAIRFVKVLWYRIHQDQCFLRASSLTFHSILSVVPILAIVFGIAKGFGIERVLEENLLEEFHDQQEVVTYFIKFGYTLRRNERWSYCGNWCLYTFFTVLRLLTNIENSLNSMWDVKVGRPLSRKICDYLALIFVGPIFFAVSSSLTVFITTQLVLLNDADSWMARIGPILLNAMPLIPYVICASLFTFLYIFIPNTRVRSKPALMAGICAGVAYQVLQASYITIQIQISRTGAIYGSFAALPLFLMWLYFSWMIFLVGSEIVVIIQERLWDTELIAPFRRLTYHEKKFGFLAITKTCQTAFLKGQPSPTCAQLSKELKLPERIIAKLVAELQDAKILLKTILPSGSQGYVPAIQSDQLHLFDILLATDGKDQIKYEMHSKMVTELGQHLDGLDQAQAESKQNVLLKDIS